MKRKGVYTYNDFITQFGGELKETDYLDRKTLEAQIQKYYGYLQKARKNPAFNMVKETLDGVVQGFSQGNINIVSLIIEMIEIFNMLQEHDFPMGKSQYPGPSTEWKKLVERYLD